MFAELFNEMLMRDFGFLIYRMLVKAPEQRKEEGERRSTAAELHKEEKVKEKEEEKKEKDKEEKSDENGEKESVEVGEKSGTQREDRTLRN